MQDVIVNISLDTVTRVKDTLLPLLLSLEGAAAYKEYSTIAAVEADFASSTATYKAAKAIFDQAALDRSPGAVAKIAILGLAATSTEAEITAALDTLRETQDGWYFLLPVTSTAAQIAALAEWADATVLTAEELAAGNVEAEKLLVVQTTGKTVIDAALQAFKNTVVVYNHDAANSYAHAAWVGRVAPYYPAAAIWKWKDLTGIPVTDETGTDMHGLLEGRYNLYISNHGKDYMSEGVCVDGEFIDTVIGRWQIKQSMRQKLVDLFTAADVVPYDDNGFTLVGDAVMTALREAVTNGIILKQFGAGAWQISLPTRAQATEQQAASRIMPPITWSATLRGGVQGVTVSGTLTVALTSN